MIRELPGYVNFGPRFAFFTQGAGLVGTTQFIDGLDTETGPVFVTGFDAVGAEWMQVWLSALNERRTLVICDRKAERFVELVDGYIDRHSPGTTGDIRTDRFTLRGRVQPLERPPEWLKA